MVAGTGRVHDFFHGPGQNRGDLPIADQEGALLASGHGGQARPGAQAVYRHGQVLGLEQGQGLGFVGEEDVHLSTDKAQEGGAVALDHEAVGEGQGDLPAGGPGQARRLGKGLPGGFSVEQVAFEIDDLRRLDDSRVDVGVGELHRGAEIGAHGALPIRRDIDQAPGRGGAVLQGQAREVDADGA